jgi:DNA (cytosine-5)-methyltransferase 1
MERFGDLGMSDPKSRHIEVSPPPFMERKMTKEFTFIDLFCGAGGLAQGFVQTSDPNVAFRGLYAVEIDRPAAASYAANFKHPVFAGPIEQIDPSTLPKADVVIGGPPCQGFSPLGKMSPTGTHTELNKLWQYFFKVVSAVNPKVFVVENVPEFLKSYEFESAAKTAMDLGYLIDWGTLNASHFGVPQQRKRGFLLGARGRRPRLPLPSPSFRTRTVWDAIGELKDRDLSYSFELRDVKREGRIHSSLRKYLKSPSGLKELEDFIENLPVHIAQEAHFGRNPTEKSLERYKCIPPGGNRFSLMEARPDLAPNCWKRKKTGSTDVMGRLEWDKPSLTIRTEFFKPEKGRYLHPEMQRPITHWEAARLQTFPDDYIFCGSKADVARQIGNAVPPLLAEAIASQVKQILLERFNRHLKQIRPYALSGQQIAMAVSS